jgi:hypothetical protein
MYLVFNVFYFYSGVGQKDSGVGRAHLAPPFATPLVISYPTSTRRHGNFAGVHTLLRIILSSNSAVLINIITGVSPPHFDFFVFYVLCQC